MLYGWLDDAREHGEWIDPSLQCTSFSILHVLVGQRVLESERKGERESQTLPLRLEQSLKRERKERAKEQHVDTM